MPPFYNVRQAKERSACILFPAFLNFCGLGYTYYKRRPSETRKKEEGEKWGTGDYNRRTSAAIFFPSSSLWSSLHTKWGKERRGGRRRRADEMEQERESFQGARMEDKEQISESIIWSYRSEVILIFTKENPSLKNRSSHWRNAKRRLKKYRRPNVFLFLIRRENLCAKTGERNGSSLSVPVLLPHHTWEVLSPCWD